MSNPMLDNTIKAMKRASTASSGTPLQYPDVMVSTGALFVALVAVSAVAWKFIPASLFVSMATLVAVIGLSILVYKMKRVTLPVALIYSGVMGVMVGSTSKYFATRYGTDIIVTAVLATGVVFAVCLATYLIPKVRASSLGRRFFLIALLGVFAFAIVSFISGAFFGVGGGWGLFGLGAFGMLLAIGITLFSAWSLMIDFSLVDDAVKGGADRYEVWGLSLGLLVSTAWIYLNILRVLGLARR